MKDIIKDKNITDKIKILFLLLIKRKDERFLSHHREFLHMALKDMFKWWNSVGQVDG